MTKAAVVQELGGDFEIWDVEVSAPRAGEVIVRLAASGICHSDASIHSGVLPFVSEYPVVLGHEGSGVVEEVGPGVTKVAPGDHVVMSFKPFCGGCWYCRHGEGYLCTAAFSDGQPTLSAGGRVVQTLGSSTFLERTVVPEHSVVKIRPDAPLAAAALLGCGDETLSLPFRAAAEQGWDQHGNARALQLARCARLGELLADHPRFQRIGRLFRAAVPLGDGPVEIAALDGGLTELGSGPLQVGVARRRPMAIEERGHLATESLVGGAELQVHPCPPLRLLEPGRKLPAGDFAPVQTLQHR